ncbi:MAG: hypothetical protein J6K74_03270 [Marinifilaceae bacterium]|nr:hypothetical protein [Marinifilaceae bacterium]
MRRYFRYLMLLIAGVLFLACNDEVNNKEPLLTVDDEYVGSVKHFLLGDETANFSQSDVRCFLMTEDGEKIMRYCTHKRVDSISEVELTTGLKDGIYRLLYFEYDLPRQNNGPLQTREFGLGGRIKVANGQVVMLDNFNASMGFSGEGTKESPFVITSAKHLERLASLVNGTLTNKSVNNSTYFAQYADIDVWEVCWDFPDGYGWYPIGFTNVLPFRGHYNGKGYSIEGLYSYRNVSSGVGLFGFIHTAEIDSVVLKGAEIYGLYATGGIAGAVVTSAGKREPSTINHCKVMNSVISGAREVNGDVDTWSASIGGIVGAVDAYAIFLANGCSVDSETVVNGANCVGGILGGGNLYSAIQIANCSNSAEVSAAYSAVGGIIGSADTVTVVACRNSNKVTGAIKYSGGDDGNSGMSAGGIIGGSGCSAISACVNSGNVSGNDGVGGIIGSTRLGDGSEVYYNTTNLRYCLNSGEISGNNNVAGLCGEAQFTGYALCNQGVVEGNNCVAGVVGYSPAAAILNCVNSASINGKEYVAGIIGQSTWGTLAINQNYGSVTSKGNYAAGVVALTGDNVILNYCENSAPIMSEGPDPKTGGVVAEFGLPSEWTADRIASVVIGALEVVNGLIISPLASATTGALLEGGMVTNKIGLYCINVGVGLFYLPADIYFYGAGVYNVFNKEYAVEIDYENELEIDKISTTITSTIQSIRNSSATWKEYDDRIEALRAMCESSDDSQLKTFNQNLNDTRNERSASIAELRETKEVIHTAIGGCCILVGTVAGIVAAIPSGGSSILVVATEIATVVGMGTSVIGGLNGIVQGCTDYTYNATIASQCVNSGEISAPNASGGYVGGVVGSTSDYAIIRDCINTASCNAPGANRGQMTGRANPKVEIYNSLAIGSASGWSGFAGTDKSSVTYGGLYYYLSGQTNVSGNYGDQGTELNSSQLGSSDSFSGWSIGSDNSLWSIQSETTPAYPIPLNSEAM